MQRATHLDESQKEITSRYLDGESMCKLGVIYGVNAATIWRRLVEWGVERRSTGRWKPDMCINLPVDEIMARYAAGESLHGLGRTYGVSGATVRMRLIEWGVERRGYRGWNPGGPLFSCGNNGRYLGTQDRDSRTCRIHRGCWEAYHGSIPSGFEIHHIDGDPLNNEIGNLACMTHSEHMRLHWAERRKVTD